MAERVPKVTESKFNEIVLESGKPAVVDFWATWCAPCRKFDEVIEEMAHKYGEKISFYKIDVNESTTISSRYSVRSIPMILFFNEGQVVDQAVGSLSREVLEEKLKGLIEIA